MDRESSIALFRNLENPDTHARFFDHVADDVDWTVEGTHPLAGRFLSKQEFLDATFGRLAGVLSDGVRAPFANRYCWVCRFDGDTIVTVRAYLDSTMVMYTMLRNERGGR
jgi:ketosteroid isomerase-like protein